MDSTYVTAGDSPGGRAGAVRVNRFTVGRTLDEVNKRVRERKERERRELIATDEMLRMRTINKE